MPSKEDYVPYKNVEEAVKSFSDKITASFDFLNLQHQTGFHEVDIKRFETKICVVVECGISAIVMVGVTLEEFLKCLLKNKFIAEKRDDSIEPSLDEIEKSRLAAEANFGFFKLHNAIEKCLKEELITEEEKNKLMDIKDNIRNAFVHSDKSKIFDDEEKGNVDAVKLEDGKLVVKESKEMNALSLFFAHGILQKELANAEARNVFEEVDELILQINDRFWESRNKTEEST